MRKLAAIGFALMAAMQLIFLLTGADRSFPYREVQLVSLAGTLLLVWGAARHNDVALAVGFGVNLFTRILQPILGITRLSLWLNVVLSVAWTWAFADALRGRAPKAGLWILGFAHFVAALTAISRLASFLALCLGAIGCFLAATGVGRGR